MSKEIAKFDPSQYGPAMLALNPRRRKFVELLFYIPAGPGAVVEAARLAGYAAKDAREASASAWHLMAQPAIKAAVAELTAAGMRVAKAPAALKAVDGVLADPKHKDHLAAARMVLDRIDPVETKQSISVVHETTTPMQDTLAYLRHLKELGVSRDKLIEEFGYTGLSILEQKLAKEDAAKGPVVDADFEEVTEDDTPKRLAGAEGEVTDENPLPNKGDEPW